MTDSGSTEPAEPEAEGATRPRSWRRTLIRSGLLLVLSFACAYIIIGLVGRIDWSAVRSSLGRLEWWQLVVLFGLLIIRQVLNAAPLTLFVSGLSLVRATVSDQASALISMVAPPPSDMVLRIAVFKSWGIEPARGLAGATMNVLAFYVNRFVAPVIGLLLLLPVRFDGKYGVIAAIGLVVAAVWFSLTVLVVRDEKFAARVGRTAGRIVSKVRRSVDPDSWAEACLEFRTHIDGKVRRGMAKALVPLMAMVVVDASILLLALRYVGVSSEQLHGLEVVAAFLVLYPLTLFPLAGVGIMDAMLVGILTGIGGLELEPEIVAALVVYRVITLGGPMALGLVAMAWLRRNLGELISKAR